MKMINFQQASVVSGGLSMSRSAIDDYTGMTLFGSCIGAYVGTSLGMSYGTAHGGFTAVGWILGVIIGSTAGHVGGGVLYNIFTLTDKYLRPEAIKTTEVTAV